MFCVCQPFVILFTQNTCDIILIPCSLCIFIYVKLLHFSDFILYFYGVTLFYLTFLLILSNSPSLSLYINRLSAQLYVQTKRLLPDVPCRNTVSSLNYASNDFHCGHPACVHRFFHPMVIQNSARIRSKNIPASTTP